MEEKNLKYKMLKVIYVPLFKILYRPKVYGKENIPAEGPVIFVGNHIHAVDPVGVMSNTKRIVHFINVNQLTYDYINPSFRVPIMIIAQTLTYFNIIPLKIPTPT